ncbi:hypothetical protein NT01EI_2144 [Edwardsiella ictaluri 93-146]|uniref:Uncharacterized protein n=1 Tax=Edwardsiella ictaluri (strain 93-146) TaxID=634503 RepID=C5BE79_EDWI9|nr:hypothetical protein NT01EI_2144 [Edwardsiella ictaluri 93-146]
MSFKYLIKNRGLKRSWINNRYDYVHFQMLDKKYLRVIKDY